MEKKIAILLKIGIPYKKSILYARERAKEIGAKLILVGIIPDLNSRKVALASYEIGPYDGISNRLKVETGEYIERAVQFCLDNNIVAETKVEEGGLEDVVRKMTRDTYTRLVIVPPPTKQEQHTEFLETIRHFAHEMIDKEIRCPVVSVLAP